MLDLRQPIPGLEGVTMTDLGRYDRIYRDDKDDEEFEDALEAYDIVVDYYTEEEV